MTRREDEVTASRILSEAQSRRESRPLLRWSDAELDAFADAVCKAFAQALGRWSSGSAFDDALGRAVDGRRVAHASNDAAFVARIDWTAADPARGGAWRAADEAPAQALRRMLFGESSPAARDDTRLADEAAAEAWADVVTLAVAAFGAGAGATEPASLAQAWSGAVLVEADCFGATLRLLFDAPAVGRVLRAAGMKRAAPAAVALVPPVSPLQAVAGAKLALEARLASFELGLGELMSLRVGDVLRTGHALDRPASVVAAGSGDADVALCQGWLGRREQSLAVELARLPAPNPR